MVVAIALIQIKIHLKKKSKRKMFLRHTLPPYTNYDLKVYHYINIAPKRPGISQRFFFEIYRTMIVFKSILSVCIMGTHGHAARETFVVE